MNIDTLLVKVASRCNINCSYCYVYNMGDEGWKDMPALMSRDTISALCSALRSLSEHQASPFAVVLHGGEPLMLGARRLEYLLRALRGAMPERHSICMQTNGMLISQEILDICDANRVSISVSIDGPQRINDKFRLGKKGESSYDKVIAGIAKLRGHPASDFLFSGLLTVVDPTSDPEEVYEFLKDLGAPSLDFLYRDGNHTNIPFGKESFESTEYGEWFSKLLRIYLRDATPVRIRFLDDIVKLSLGGTGVKEGLGQAEYGIAIVETDGTIGKNDTLKSTSPGADRFSNKWSVHTDRIEDIARSDEFADYHQLQKPSSPSCKNCEQVSICGGGMPLHRWMDGRGFENPSVYCNDQKLIIQSVKRELGFSGVRL